MQDVTHAYKSILAEKQALEITIKALKTKNVLSTSSQGLNNKPKASTATPTNLSASSRSVSTSDVSEVEFQSNDQSELNSNQEDRIQALTSNIQLLLETKSKMEQSYQAEKKKLRVCK